MTRNFRPINSQLRKNLLENFEVCFGGNLMEENFSCAKGEHSKSEIIEHSFPFFQFYI